MANIAKREFAALNLDGCNYLQWVADVEMHLMALELNDTILTGNKCSVTQKAKAMIFLRHHLEENLKMEYLIEHDPAILWQSLKDRFYHQKNLILPQAQYDWMHLRFQDYKSVTEYNSAIHQIVSKLKLCKRKVTDVEMIEKTLSTFHANNLVLQQQYGANNYATHSELISALLVAEKHDQLLMKNHNARPRGYALVLEAHVVQGAQQKKSEKKNGPSMKNRFNGRKHFFKKGSNQWRRKKPNAPEEKPKPKPGNGTCHRCGSNDHWSRTCRTPKHLVDLYQKEKLSKKANFFGGSTSDVIPHENTKLDINDFGDFE